MPDDIEDARLGDGTYKVKTATGYTANFRFNRGELVDDVPEHELESFKMYGFKIEGYDDFVPVVSEVADWMEVARRKAQDVPVVPTNPVAQTDLLSQLLTALPQDMVANIVAQAIAAKSPEVQQAKAIAADPVIAASIVVSDASVKTTTATAPKGRGKAKS